MKRALRLLPLLIAGLLLQACGFQMRTAPPLPPQLKTLQVVGDQNSNLYRMVVNRLKIAGVDLVSKADKNTPILRVNPLSQTSTVASLTDTGTTAETVVEVYSTYTLTVPGEEPQLYNLHFTRSYINQSNQVLASSESESSLSSEMEIQAANQILAQLSRYKP
ncbi:LPS-assembly lipoprotein LptE [Dongshaea marina]|uniref:LPS-assembly lipoprotein LptE n=1 Tax=Dongshaea marina TaxID=2047966 RepID=UPI000D3E721C|nr:LPS assembly lipoprotein LptE [Dongshaea marina]